MRLLRRFLPLALGLLVLGLFAGFAWLTHHYDDPRVEAAEHWPGVGWAVQLLRDRYLGTGAPWERGAPVTASQTAAEGSISSSAGIVQRPEILDARPSLWVAAGTELRREPSESAPAVVVIEPMANLPVLERRGEWVRSRSRGEEGWVLLSEPEEGAPPPLGSAPEPVLPLPEAPPDRQRLDRALALLGPEARRLEVGSWALYTDSEDEALLSLLDRAASRLEQTYRQRYGVEPVGTARAAVILYSRSRDYWKLSSAEVDGAVIGRTGHALQGLVALLQGGRPDGEVAATLIHELVHLLNRRALGPALPPWLEEGLAVELAEARLEPDGTILPGTLGRTVVRGPAGIETRGGVAALHTLATSVDRGLPLETLVGLSQRQFMDPAARSLRYAQAAFLVRFLLEGELAEPFRAFLAEIARGGPVTGDALLGHLGLSWNELDRDFRSWLRDQASAVPLTPG